MLRVTCSPVLDTSLRANELGIRDGGPKVFGKMHFALTSLIWTMIVWALELPMSYHLVFEIYLILDCNRSSIPTKN